MQLLPFLFKCNVLVLFGNYLFLIGSVIEMWLCVLKTEDTL